jgi:hypothetical protein
MIKLMMISKTTKIIRKYKLSAINNSEIRKNSVNGIRNKLIKNQAIMNVKNIVENFLILKILQKL